MQRPPMLVQTLLFAKERWTVPKACAWARAHDWACHKVDTSGEFIRLRQIDPERFRPGSFRTVYFGGTKLHGSLHPVQAVMGHLR